MTVAEPTSEELFAGLGKHAETHLPPAWSARMERIGTAAIDLVVALVQIAWVAALVYAAYRFLS
jgi:hypothetical protein